MLAIFRRNLIIVMFLSIISATSIAEDIDLFTGVTPSGSTDVPNVLIILGNTANWNTAFTNEINALSTVLGGLAVNKFRVGLMMFSIALS